MTTVTAPATGARAPRLGRLRGLGLPGAIPLALLLLVAFVGPLLILMGYSVGLLGQDTRPGVSRYAEALGDDFYRGVLRSTLRLGLTVTVGALLLGYPVAWTIARARGRRRTIMLAILIAPLLPKLQ